MLEEAHELSNYGILIRYFPLRSIRNIRFDPTRDQVWLRLTVGVGALGEETSVLLSEHNAICLSDGLQRFTPSIAVEWTSAIVGSLTQANPLTGCY